MSLNELIKTVAKLRSPDGCPWDKEQTHETLKRYLIEETYEAIDAIESSDPKHIMEELGDVLLQVILHAQIASENNEFNIDDVANCINQKMVNRHPHVFSNVKVNTAEEVMVNWEKLKKEEKPHRKDILEGIPIHLPALMKALKVSKKAAKEGFEWKDKQDLWNTLDSEFKELKEAISSGKKQDQEEELGDLLFMIVNIARWYKIDPEDVLNKGIKKFIARYSKVKQLSKKDLKELTYKELNELWEEAKKN